MKKSQDTNLQTFGEFFRQKRLSLDLTLRQFCEKYHYDPGNISKLERNILSPSIDEEKLEGYALALKISRDTSDWTTFFDLAHTAKGTLPTDIRRNPDMLSVLPAFYRTVRGKKLDRKKINELIKLIKDNHGK
ncbi:helix-turn-helix transcriptional regulator [Candidatus Daviesbacteria bacterium]|nr:helix-turn-helix transcriptional regulator [Candidatus Daviesbacteria bacterium]